MRGARSRVVWTVVAVSALSIVTFASSAGPAPADGPNGRAPASANEWSAPQDGQHARPSDGIFGVVPASSDSTSGWHRPRPSDFAGSSFATPVPLTYHGGPVMTTNKTYAIYWLPPGSSVSANYTSLINQYFTDVAAASGSSSNVYATDTQYYQGSSPKIPIAYSSTFAGSATDYTTPIPTNHCSSQYTSRGLTVTGCVTDADIQAEIASVMASKGWAPSPSSIFLLFTPINVGSCVSSNSSTCSYTYYCAYHSDFQTGSGDVIYANQPYPDSTGVGAPGACDSGQKPNGDWADQTINLISHEHNESITDPNGNAWYDSAGNENGDKCAWNFGTPLGSTPTGDQYNQVINNHDYYVQQEYSNASNGCALGYAAPAPPTVSGFTPTSGQVGTSVVITGTGFTGVTAVAFNGKPATYSVISTTQITTTVPSGATTGPVSVTATAGNATSTGSFTVTAPAPPTVSGFMPTSGQVGTNVTISGTGFTGVAAVAFNGKPATYSIISTTQINATVPSGATTGPISVTATAGNATSTGSFTVLPTTAPDFTLTATPPSQTVTRGKSTTYSVTVTGTGGFTGSVHVTVSGVPSRANASINPNNVSPGGSSTMTVNTASRTPTGTYTLKVTGTGGDLNHSTTVTLVVQ